MKKQCIIFVLKNHEEWLIKNIEKILKFRENFDLYFVTRVQSDHVDRLLKNHNLVNIPLSYDPGYYSALCAGFQFVQNLKYHTWIEFGECDLISLDEINKFNTINQDYNLEKSVIFGSRFTKFNKFKKNKKYILFSIGKKIYDPYTKFRIYNENAFEAMKYLFQFNMSPQNFLNLIYKKPNYIEVKIKSYKRQYDFKHFLKKIEIKFKLYIYALFVLPYIKRNGLNKY